MNRSKSNNTKASGHEPVMSKEAILASMADALEDILKWESRVGAAQHRVGTTQNRRGVWPYAPTVIR